MIKVCRRGIVSASLFHRHQPNVGFSLGEMVIDNTIISCEAETPVLPSKDPLRAPRELFSSGCPRVESYPD